MTTYNTEMNVFRSQVRYPITPADPLDDVMEKTYYRNADRAYLTSFILKSSNP